MTHDTLLLLSFTKVMEEVGFDMKDRAYDDQYLERDLNGQLIRLYIVKQVPLDTKFAAKTKNEIKVVDRCSIEMKFTVSLLGNALVSPFRFTLSPT